MREVNIAMTIYHTPATLFISPELSFAVIQDPPHSQDQELKEEPVNGVHKLTILVLAVCVLLSATLSKGESQRLKV